jgi:phage terminase large subunit GpA-like protein
MSFAATIPIIRGAAEAFRPPRRISVAQGAAETLQIRQPGGYSGPWSASETPYMVEPMDMLSSRRHEAVCFVGPARTGKTMGLLDAWLAHCVCHDPGDMLIVQMSQEKAREFSKVRVARAVRHSPRLLALMSSSGHDDNTHDKLFKHGMWVKIGWPSATQLSSSDYRYVGLTDYDRMPDDIDGEGSPYQLGLKRTTTFLSRGMCMVESSPGRDIEDPHWQPSTPHEAPPVTGVLGIYNRGDRRRWHWKCPDCGDYFEAAPGLSLFATLPSFDELVEVVRAADLVSLAEKHAKVTCPHCGTMIESRWKPKLNDIKTGRWVPDGATVDRDGQIIGQPVRSSIASYWLGGVAAAYQSWDSLLLRYLQGVREFALSGSTHTLKATVNTDQGMPFLDPALAADQSASVESRAEAGLERYVVPPQARFLVATADVQGGSLGRFVCEVRAFGPHLESWLVDRFSLTTTTRDGQAAQVDPAGYAEDWDLLTEKLVKATYRLTDGREMRIVRVGVDTGGEAGTTHNAYAWYRRLRRAGLTQTVRLLKGGSYSKERPQEKPMLRGHARTNSGQPMKDMPIWLIDTDAYKDAVAASLRRTVPGPAYFHPPPWVPASYWEELRAEVRDAKGRWKKIRPRNEALDLWVYALALVEELGFGPKGRLNWDSPPGWARPQDDENTEVIAPEERRAEKSANVSAGRIKLAGGRFGAAN